MSASMAKAEGAAPQRRESQRIINKKAGLVQMCISTVCQADERDTILSSEINSVEIDLSHFVFQGSSSSKNGRTLGLGGFGVVRRAVKLTGDDRGVEYAMKSMSKSAILKRSSGPSSVMTELRALIMLLDCQFVCSIRYAFQDPKYLYIVLDLARGGDMRYNMRTTAFSRFSESAAKYYLCQIILAVSYCHKLSILHRGTNY